MTDDDLTRALYDNATDAEASMLDDLRKHAGIIWECGACRWYNTADAPVCEECGFLRGASLDEDDDEDEPAR